MLPERSRQTASSLGTKEFRFSGRSDALTIARSSGTSVPLCSAHSPEGQHLTLSGCLTA